MQKMTYPNEAKTYRDYPQVISALEQLHDLADLPDKSNYIIDRPQITGKDSVITPAYNNKIFIYETDEALCTLLNTILKLQGFQTVIMNQYRVPKKSDIPALIIVDAGDLEKKNGLNLCYKLKQSEDFRNTKIIVTSIIHDKELILNTGADLYLPKPYDISTLIKWIDNLMKEFNK